MPSDATLDPAFFDRRFLIEIEAWEPTLHLGLSSEQIPMEFRFQGGLSYERSVDITGRVIAPKAHRDKSIRVWLSQFGAEVSFGPAEDQLNEVGRLYLRPEANISDLSASLDLPESSFPFAVTCLASCWRYLHLWMLDEDGGEASISEFSFSSIVHKNLESWIAGD